MVSPLDVRTFSVAPAINAFAAGRQGAREKERRNALLQIGQAAQGGNLDAAANTAFGAGLVNEGLQINNLVEQRAERAEDRAFRERQEGRAERALQSQIENSRFNQRIASAELGLKKLKVEFQRQGGFKDLKERAGVEEGLRKEFTGLSKDFIKIRDSFRRVQASAQDPSPAGDLALIFNYMKILDPGSVVRESEFATAENAAGVPDRIRSMYNRVRNGKRLAPGPRRDFVDSAQRLFEQQEKQHSALVKQFEGIGNRLGVDIRNVTPEFGSVPGPARAAPPPAAVQFLRQNSGNPDVIRQFEEKYGVSAQQVLGAR